MYGGRMQDSQYPLLRLLEGVSAQTQCCSREDKEVKRKECQLGDGCVDDGDQGGGCDNEKNVAERGREG